MKLYPLFLMMATITVLTPGPGVVMTLTNTLRYGLRRALGGILGIAAGALVVAGLSATGLGILLSTSATAFTAMKLLGAAYLLYLGIRLWRSPAFHFTARESGNARFARFFAEGLSLQLTNPKAIFFFLSVLPQFIDAHVSFASQFLILVLTYSGLVVAIHCLYGVLAQRAETWLTSERGGKIISKTGAITFMLFSVGLASTSR
ncbi:LysE family translocator [Rugamonas apoptosis]|uniref:LysE family translocator n=1 Tax=Rugamonas apoptosis TaxID=2758570 RepID=A0A7W2IK98_9BURK|nr:LysE family translocator [Rugamonas apoptosis]MBA5687136.1 LysE family translocator [Rugamonas apoptosis]